MLFSHSESDEGEKREAGIDSPHEAEQEPAYMAEAHKPDILVPNRFDTACLGLHVSKTRQGYANSPTSTRDKGIHGIDLHPHFVSHCARAAKILPVHDQLGWAQYRPSGT